MWIQEVELRNFGPHRHLKLELTQGLVGIFGANGEGKSHVVDGIYAALTGDFTRFAGVKTDNICDMAGEDEDSFVRVLIRQGDDAYEVCRGLRPNRSWFRGPDGRKIVRAGDIQEAVESVIGADKHMLDRYVFVRQWELFAFLQDTPGDRAAAYQRLCGTERAQQLHDEIGTFLADNPVQCEDLATQSDQLRARIQELTTLVAVAKLAKQAASDKLLDAEQLELYTAARRAHESAGIRRQQLERVTARIAEAEKAIDGILVLQKSTEQDLADVVADLCAREPKIERAHRLLDQHDAFGRYARAKEKIERVLAEAQEALEQNGEAPALPDNANQLDDIQLKRHQLAERYAKLQAERQAVDGRDEVRMSIVVRAKAQDDDEVLFALGESGAKWYNAQEIQTPFAAKLAGLAEKLGDPQHAAALDRQLAEIKSELDVLSKQVRQINTAQSARSEWERQTAALQARRQAAEENLQDLEPVVEPSAPREKIQAFLASCEKLEQRKSQLQTEQRIQDTQLKSVRENLEKYQAEAQEHKKALSDALTAGITLDEACAALEAHTTAQQKYAAAHQRYEMQADALATAEQQLEQVEAELSQKYKEAKFAERLHEIRDVMHRKNLPAIVAQENLMAMEADINHVLSRFGNPFWVEASEDLSFQVHFPGQPPRTAERLSGGQKAVLAVAFRTAVSTRFGAEVGMMAMDEPTAGMDEQNVEYLASALTQFAAEIRGSRQVIMITHAPGLRAAFDQVVDISELKAKSL